MVSKSLSHFFACCNKCKWLSSEAKATILSSIFQEKKERESEKSNNVRNGLKLQSLLLSNFKYFSKNASNVLKKKLFEQILVK